MTTPTNERDEFEQWAISNRVEIDKTEVGYRKITTHYAWEAWQAARAKPLDEQKPLAISKEVFDIIGYLVSMAAIYDDKHAKHYADKLDNLLVENQANPSSNTALVASNEALEAAVKIAEIYSSAGSNVAYLIARDIRALKAGDVPKTDGWQWVPVEPTVEMINEGQCGCMDNDVTVCIYKAMLAASPKKEG